MTGNVSTKQRGAARDRVEAEAVLTELWQPLDGNTTSVDGNNNNNNNNNNNVNNNTAPAAVYRSVGKCFLREDVPSIAKEMQQQRAQSLVETEKYNKQHTFLINKVRVVVVCVWNISKCFVVELTSRFQVKENERVLMELQQQLSRMK
jgi:hypothetical protein